MEVFTVSFNRKCDFVEFIRNRRDVPVRGMSEKTVGNNSHLEIYSDKCIRQELADVLTGYILGPYRSNLASRYIFENYPYVSESEKNEILKMLPYEQYADEIRNLILKHMENNNNIDITGFVRFRMPAFARNTEADVNRSADSFLAAKEFEEMVSLLKYHIKKTPANGIANIIFKTDDFIITDAEEKKVDLSDFPCPDGTKKADLIVGIIVGLAPEKIIIHNEYLADPAAISALKTVFDGKISICPGCKYCIAIKN